MVKAVLFSSLSRSGKSSIQKVVFHKMSPSETLFLETTNSIVKEDISNSSFVQFSIWDFPGQVDFFGSQFESEKVFERCGAIIWVIDAQDDIGESLQKLGTTMSRAIQFKSDIRQVDKKWIILRRTCLQFKYILNNLLLPGSRFLSTKSMAFRMIPKWIPRGK